MQEKEKPLSRKKGSRKKRSGSKKSKKKDEAWFLYVLKCNDDTFYTGITKDLERRFKMHNDGKAARYTRVRRPVEMLYQEPCGSRTEALVRECAVKAYSRKQKEALIEV